MLFCKDRNNCFIFLSVRTRTGVERFCLRLWNAGLEIRIQKIAIRKKRQLEHSKCIWVSYANVRVRWGDLSREKVGLNKYKEFYVWVSVHHKYILYRVSQNYVNTQIVETIYSQNIHDMCKMIYRTVSTCSPSCLTHNNQRATVPLKPGHTFRGREIIH